MNHLLWNKQTNHIHKYIKLLTPASSTPASEKYLACSHCSILQAFCFQPESNLKRKNYHTLSSSYKEAWPASGKVGLWGGESQKQPITSSKILKYTREVLVTNTLLLAHCKHLVLKSKNHVAEERRERKGLLPFAGQTQKMRRQYLLQPSNQSRTGSSNVCQGSDGCKPSQLLWALLGIFCPHLQG